MTALSTIRGIRTKHKYFWNKKGKYKKVSNEICEKCRNKLHGIYSFTRQHSESEKIIRQITNVTVLLKKLKTFFVLTDLKTEFEAIPESDKDTSLLECRWTVADIECHDSAVSKVVVKNEVGNKCEGTDFSKVIKKLNVGFLEGEYSNVADARSVERKKIDCIGNADAEQITIEEEIIKEEWTMQEGEIFEAKSKRDVLYGVQTKFSCDICDEQFFDANHSHEFNEADTEDNTQKEGHTQWFHTKKDFACDQSDANYIKKGSDMCDAKFKYKNNLAKHKLSHTNELLGFKYYCCNMKFTTKASLRHHRLSRICESCKCLQCDVKLSNKKSLRKHLKMVHPIGNYSCEQCEKQFKHKNSLNIHQQSHAGVVLKCDNCDATFKSKRDLNLHKKIHQMSDTETFKCNKCDECFSSRICLTRHFRTVHTDSVFARDHCDSNYKRILFNCDQCNAKYKSSEGFRNHKASHTGVSFTCNKCDASFSNKRSLTQHVRKVHTDALLSCDHCDATYKSKQGLREHKLNHSGIAFNCDQCDAKYKTNEGLRQHKISHTGVTFPCNKCDASFNNKRSLTRHLRAVHTDIVFSCNQCDASYKNKKSLKRHKQIHSGKFYNCDQCTKFFIRKESLMKHKLSQHVSAKPV